MRRAAFFLIFMFSAASALAHGAGAFKVTGPEVRVADGEAHVSVTLVNREEKPVKIVGAFSPSAERTELRRGAKPVSRFDIPGNGTLRLSAGGDEIVLVNLTRSLEPGDLVPVILRLDDGDTYAVMARVAR